MKIAYLAPFAVIICFTGCTDLQAVTAVTTGSVATAVPQAMIAAKKGLIAAHGLHEAAADALTAAAKSGLCKASCASQAKTYLDTSEAYLVAADHLVAIGDAPGIEAKISAANALVSQVEFLTKGN